MLLRGLLVVAAIAVAGAAVAQAPLPTPPPLPSSPGELKAGDAFGEPITLPGSTIVVQKGTANWDTAFDTLVDAFKTVKGYLDKEGLKPSGPATAVYLSTDDTGFQFEAGYPVAEPPKATPRGDLAVTKLPDGKALKFTHRGAYDAMDTTYDAITNHLDEKQLDARDQFIEEYATDPTTTPQDELVITVLVPIK